jgi:hypothetical protein
MPNLFDGLAQTTFGIVAKTMGYEVSWLPLAGGAAQTATVLFKDASETAKLLQVDYDPQRAMMEYFDADLVGLKASVDAKNDEIVIVNGISYGVNEIRADFDGKTMVAQLQAI